MIETWDSDRELQRLLDARDRIRDFRLKVQEMKEKLLEAESATAGEAQQKRSREPSGGATHIRRNK